MLLFLFLENVLIFIKKKKKSMHIYTKMIFNITFTLFTDWSWSYCT